MLKRIFKAIFGCWWRKCEWETFNQYRLYDGSFGGMSYEGTIHQQKCKTCGELRSKSEK